MRIQFILGAIATAMVAGTNAQAAGGHCRQEIRQLCGNLEPGDGRLRQCVEEHKAQLSPQCQAKIERRQERVKEVLAVCAEDLKQKCSDIVPGGGRKLMCLAAHEPTLSPACAAMVKKGRQRLHGMRACRDDAEALCPNVPRGEGRVKACLEAHRAQLSPACSAVMADG